MDRTLLGGYTDQNQSQDVFLLRRFYQLHDLSEFGAVFGHGKCNSRFTEYNDGETVYESDVRDV